MSRIIDKLFFEVWYLTKQTHSALLTENKGYGIMINQLGY